MSFKGCALSATIQLANRQYSVWTQRLALYRTDHRHANIGKIVENLVALIVNLCPNIRVSDIAEAGKNRCPASSRRRRP